MTAFSSRMNLLYAPLEGGREAPQWMHPTTPVIFWNLPLLLPEPPGWRLGEHLDYLVRGHPEGRVLLRDLPRAPNRGRLLLGGRMGIRERYDR